MSKSYVQQIQPNPTFTKEMGGSNDAEKMYKMLKSTNMEKRCVPRLTRCGFCGGTATSFKMLSNEAKTPKEESCFDGADVKKKECRTALVFFRTRYAALLVSESLQSPNPLSWATNAAPEPRDIFWSNLCVPHQIFWIRKIMVLVASMLFVIFFLIPVVFTQLLVHLDKLQFPFLKNFGRRKVLVQLITGYLPSVVFIIFLYLVPPVMMFFSTIEGAISRSGRKRKAAINNHQFTFTKLRDAKNIPNLLAKAVPATATYFMTFVLTSGCASLSCEIIQPFPLLCNLFCRYIRRNVISYSAYTFPYHTEVPRVLLFGVLGFTCSTMAPLILPFLLVYFFLAYLVYRNQIIIEMDRKDEHCREEMHQRLQSSYCQFRSKNLNLHSTSECSNKPQSVLGSVEMGDAARAEDLKNSTSAVSSFSNKPLG
ncbi:UNVERIFIED_CONTAM: CSC1-like protein RXW8 [Sesamum calycinum]|uniref:CSC1-like protein RXW8 n=1 Tax=Sesamum calycinum TaxID=2727403 RepID=A0AAW2P8K2_9LAMI